MGKGLFAHHRVTDIDLNGDVLIDQLIEEFASESNRPELGLHGLFQVSDEEEASWYDMSSVRIRSFPKLLEYLEKKGYWDVRVGYIRKAFRASSEDCRTFFPSWLSMLEIICQDKHLDEYHSIGNSSLVTFMSICYFAAEFHATELYQPILRIVRKLHRSNRDDPYMPISDFVYQHLTSVLYATFDGDFDALMETLLDPEMDPELGTRLGFMLLQYVHDGVLSQERQTEMLDRYLQFIFDHHKLA